MLTYSLFHYRFWFGLEIKNGLAVISKFSSAARKCLQREKNAFFKKYAFLNKQLWFSPCPNAPRFRTFHQNTVLTQF